MKPYTASPELLWKPDPQVDEARKNPHWKDFHRVAGTRFLYFDRPAKEGRGYATTAYTAKKNSLGGWTTYHLADGKGRTVIESIDAAYQAAGRKDAELDRLIDLMCGRIVEEEDDFEGLFD